MSCNNILFYRKAIGQWHTFKYLTYTAQIIERMLKQLNLTPSQ